MVINERASILELTKGKFTTDPDNHTGQGIFFTSRAVDEFALASSKLIYLKKNLEDDWFIETPNNPVKGTIVSLRISITSNRKLEEVFQKYESFDESEGIRQYD